MIESVRARLTLWYVSVLAAVLIAVGITIYVGLGRALYNRIDDNLRALTSIAVTSLTHDLAEGQDASDAARSTTTELFSNQAVLAVYDGAGRLLAEEGQDDDLQIVLPPLDSIPRDEPLLYTVVEARDADDRHRVAVRRARILPSGTEFVVLVSSDLEPTDEELEFLRRMLMYLVPATLLLAAVGGWFLARQSLRPVGLMAERAQRIGVEDLGARLPIGNPRDELGRLAGIFNDLLERLAASFTRQRQFMADASHELRTPVATARTAASVALQQPHRAEGDYRETLRIIEQQAERLTRVVEDMFTLARADAGNYPVRREPVYLEELVVEVVRAARVLASNKRVTIEPSIPEHAPTTGDEELLRRMIANLVDNAVKYAPQDSVVRVELSEVPSGYAIAVSDTGPGIPLDVRDRVFERFYRGEAARERSSTAVGGAGLGLAITRWIATLHGGDVRLVESTGLLTTFRIDLPRDAVPPESSTRSQP
jgi:heavy metal sensor kinase